MVGDDPQSQEGKELYSHFSQSLSALTKLCDHRWKVNLPQSPTEVL